MRKCFLIGAHVGPEHTAKAREVLSLPEDVQIICVSKVEDIPIEDRMQQISEMRRLNAPPPLLEIPQIYWEKPKKKGHEPPYKYHR